MKESGREYYEDEVRDGFFVPAIMKKCWAYSKKLYDEFAKLCEESGVICNAFWGTLLGTVRHAGFIPWDDDIDLEMMRGDYKKLYRMYEENHPQEYYILDDIAQNCDDADTVRRYTKRRDGFVSPEYWKDQCGFPFNGILDIMLMDYAPDNPDERELYRKSLICQAQKVAEEKNRENGDKKKLIELIKKYEELGEQYSERKEYCSKIVSIVWWLLNENYIREKSLCEEKIDMPFEDGCMKVPIGYDHVLRMLYSNYMYPQIDGSSHGYPYFSLWEKELEKEYSYKLLRYEYDGGQLCAKEYSHRESIKEQFTNYIMLLREAHQSILDGESEISAECQNLAIQMAEQVEDRAVESKRFVHVLEEYCEFMYAIYQQLCIDDMEGKLLEFEEECMRQIECLQEKREIVFLVYESRYWRYLHSLWEEASGDKNFIVTVIPVPYFYRGNQFDLEKDMQIETKGYPQQVILTSYENYNFEVHRPEIVIYQFPYDEYNYALSWHPYFYISNIRQYAEKMIFIPPYVLREFDAKNEKNKYALRWLLQTPGAVYADYIFVQSKNMKKIYEELLTEFTNTCASEESRSASMKSEEINWSEKIIDTGSPCWDWETKRRVLIKIESEGQYRDKNGDVTEKTIQDDLVEIPDEWGNKIQTVDKKRKKLLLYYVSGSVLFEYGEKMIKKIEEFFITMEKYKDKVAVLWYPDFYTMDILKNKKQEIWSKYQKLVEQYRKLEFVLVESKIKYNRVTELCDAIYGDGGTVMTECRKRHKLVLFETPNLPIKQSDTYVYKKWIPEIQVAVEGEWSLENIICEMELYKYEVPIKDCGRNIWKAICGELDKGNMSAFPD